MDGWMGVFTFIHPSKLIVVNLNGAWYMVN